MTNQKNIPIGLWKKYRIVISGGLSNEHFVKAPNKTIARSMAKGDVMHNAYIIIFLQIFPEPVHTGQLTVVCIFL